MLKQALLSCWSVFKLFGRRVGRFLLLLLGLVGVIFTVAALIPLSIWRYSSVDETRQADAAIVLGAAVYDDKPSPVFLERIRHGITLYQAGTVNHIVFTGARDQYDSVSEADVGRNVALEAGVPDKDILVEDKSIQTWGNLANSVPILEDAGIQSVLIVSDPLHMKRAMVMAKDLGMEAYAAPTPTSKYESRDAKLGLLKTETVYYIIYKVRTLLGYEDHK